MITIIDFIKNHYIIFIITIVIIDYLILLLIDLLYFFKINSVLNKLATCLPSLITVSSEMKELQNSSRSRDQIEKILEDKYENNHLIKENYDNLLRLSPDIKNILGYYYVNDFLDRNKDFPTNIQLAKKLSNYLLNYRDQAEFNFKHNRSIQYTIYHIFMLPVTFLRFLRIDISSVKLSKFLSFIVWLLIFLLNMFSDDIKQIIITLLKETKA